MADARLIRSLESSNVPAMLQLMKQYLFGDVEIRRFSETKVYMQGDVVIFDNPNGGVIIRQPLEDNLTGTFDETKWSEVIISDVVWRNLRDYDMVIVSDIAPETERNQIWFRDIGTRYVSDEFSSLFERHFHIESGTDLISITNEAPHNITNLIWYEPINCIESDDFDNFDL